MPTESLAKRNVTSGTLEFKVGSDRLLEVPVPVAESKTQEAVDMMNEELRVALHHYYKSDKLNPRDVAESLRKIADAIERNQMMITEEKYHGRSRKRPQH